MSSRDVEAIGGRVAEGATILHSFHVHVLPSGFAQALWGSVRFFLLFVLLRLCETSHVPCVECSRSAGTLYVRVVGHRAVRYPRVRFVAVDRLATSAITNPKP